MIFFKVPLGKYLLYLIPISVLFFGVAIRFYGLGHQLFWGDEAWNIRMAHDISWNIPHLISRDSHPPLLHILLKLLMNTLGVQNPLNLRLLSLIPGIALLALGLIWGSQVSKHWLGGLTLVWVIASSPLLIEQSQEVRNYSLMLALLGMVFFLITKEKFGKFELFSASLFLCLASLTHYSTILLVPSLLLAGVFQIQRCLSSKHKEYLFFWIGICTIALLFILLATRISFDEVGKGGARCRSY